jgi:hypothetical protein
MTLTRFLYLLDLHGPDLEHWPPAALQVARAALDSSDDAHAALAEARRLDALLRAAAPIVDERTVARVLGRAARAAERPRSPLVQALWRWGLMPLWPRVSFLAAALALGLLVGSQLPGLRVGGAEHPGLLASLIDGLDPFAAWPW